MPGASISRGRYRLLVFHGGAPHLQFWQALDTALNRQVALTFVDPDGELPDDEIREILARTMKLSRIDKLGIARILDVVHTGIGGSSSANGSGAVRYRKSPTPHRRPRAQSRAMQTLAAAAEAAHHAGVALSIDHPGRVRVSIEGDVVLAFPATMPDISPEDDIRGIGAALYALLVNRWPLPESGEPSGMAPAPRDSAGHVLEPSAIDERHPVPDLRGGHSLDSVGRWDTQCRNTFEPPAAGHRGGRPDRAAQLRSTRTSRRRRRCASRACALTGTRRGAGGPRRRRAIMIGVGAGAAVIVVALVVLASVLSKMFSDVSGLDKDQLGLNGPSTSSSSARNRRLGQHHQARWRDGVLPRR